MSIMNRTYEALPAAILPDRASLRERNIALVNALEEIFNLSALTELNQLKALMSAERVKLIHNAVASIFPRSTDFDALTDTSSNELRAYYMAGIEPDTILRNIVRYSLYTDQIYFLCPLLNPISIAPDLNPLLVPELYRQYTLKIVIALKQLLPWIRSGIVQLIPDPSDFNYEFRKKTWLLADARLKNMDTATLASLLQDDDEEGRWKAEIERCILAAPTDILEVGLRTLFPAKTDKEIAAIMVAMHQRRDGDMQALSNIQNQILIGVGGNLELSTFLSTAFSAYPYTNKRVQWKELSLSSSAPTDPWSPLTKAFQELNFAFLDSADVDFAANLRDDGRLGPFRSFLKKTWSGVKSADSWSTESARSYVDELKAQHRTAQAEWDKINQDLLKWGGVAAGSFITGSTSLVTGNLGFTVPSAAVFIGTITELGNLISRKKIFPKTMPVSIFMELEKGF